MKSPAIGLWLVGASGRMGRAIRAVAEAAEDVHICGAIGSAGADRSVEEHGYPVVVVDFSAAEGALAAVAFADRYGYPLVSGTTGLDARHTAAYDAASQRIALLHAGNMSVGVHLIAALARQAAAAVPGWDVEITEVHHRLKKDAPSGTALLLADAVEAGRPGTEHQRIGGRHGLPGARPDHEIGLHALRGGDVVGEHTVWLFGHGERIELTHRATDRRLFAEGALRAARWLVDRPAGRYQMADVLGLPVA